MNHLHAAPTALCLALVTGLATAQNGRYDVRFRLHQNDPAIHEALVDIEIKASSASETFYMAHQNYRFSVNTSAIPPVSPPIDHTESNPTDRSVHVAEEGSISGFTMTEGLPSFFLPHSTVGSIEHIVSINVTFDGGSGYLVREFGNNPHPPTCAGSSLCSVPPNGWVPVTRIRLDTVPGGGVATLTFHSHAPEDFPPTFVGETVDGNLYEVTEGSYTNLVFDTSVPFPCTTGSIVPNPGCPAGHHALGGPVLGFAGSSPQLGTDLTIAADNLAGSVLCSLLIGEASAPIPLSLIGSTVPGSALCIAPWMTVPCGGAGSASVVLPIPNEPILCETFFDVQWIDHGGTGLDFGSSQSVRLTVGG